MKREKKKRSLKDEPEPLRARSHFFLKRRGSKRGRYSDTSLFCVSAIPARSGILTLVWQSPLLEARDPGLTTGGSSVEPPPSKRYTFFNVRVKRKIGIKKNNVMSTKVAHLRRVSTQSRPIFVNFGDERS